MITIRPAAERGTTKIDWLDSKHTFSFADYYDPRHMSFGALRVINDDRIAPGMGFGTHPHRDMEIVTWVFEGALQHRDSLGNGSVIRPGDAQRMSAGTGIRHSEFNASKAEDAKLLQIWIVPERQGLEPGYEQKPFAPEALEGKLALIGSRDGRDGSVVIHQDVDLYASRLADGDRVSHDLKPGRQAWVQVAEGEVELNGEKLVAGDGAAVTDETRIELRGVKQAEVLVFDLA